MKSNYFVYLIECDNNMKIGITNNVKSRMATLQTGNAKKLELYDWFECESRNVAELLEETLHNIFAKYRKCGEWFEAEPVKDYLEKQYMNKSFKIGEINIVPFIEPAMQFISQSFVKGRWQYGK